MKLSHLASRLRRYFRRVTPDAAFAEWATTYDEHTNLLIEVEQSVMAELLGELRDAAVLDVACGTGRLMRLARQAGAGSVVGLDRCAPMVRRADGNRVVGDMTRLPFADASFDCVTAGLALGYVPTLDDFVREAARVLCPGGRLLCSDLHPRGNRLGWQRTFQRADGGTVVVPGCIHGLDEIHRAVRVAGMKIIEVREPSCSDLHARATQPVNQRCGAGPKALIWLARLG